MSKTDKKLAVISALKHHGKAVTMPELMALLDAAYCQYSDRSVRRWLDELTTEGEVIKLGSKKGTRYQAAHLEQSETMDSNPSFTEQSQEAMEYLQQPIYLRQPKTYQKDFLNSYQANTSFYLSEVQRSQLHQQGARSYNHELAGTYARHIYNRLLIDLSYNSSRLEGNTYSLLDTEKLVIEGISDTEKPDAERTMILNHKEAIRYIVDNAVKLSFSLETICTLHYLLADGLLPPTQVGTFRNSAVKVGGSSYLPLSNAPVIKSIMEIICQKASAIRDPFEQSFFLLVHIAYLQSFEDCNKRTSRLAANIPLIKQNLVPLSFNDISKEDYAGAVIAVYELNDIKPLAELYCFSYLRACELYTTNVESMGFDRVRIAYREQRRSVIGHIVAKKISGKEIEKHVKQQSKKLIPTSDQTAFEKAVLEDLALLSPSRIAGVGITVKQLEAWQRS